VSAPRACALAGRVAETLQRPADPAARAMARHLAKREGVVAVLFYGNRLRHPEGAGLLDLYVLTESDAAYHGHGLSALANRLLPPNVYHERLDDPAIGAKVAVISLPAFRRRMRRGGPDTTLWARFAQPAALLHARDAAARTAVIEAIAEAWRTAAWWADRLEPGETRWAGLFAATYGAELRVEGAARSSAITAADPALYGAIDRLLPPETVSPQDARQARRVWRRQRRIGKGLNILRLAKAALTFRGGISYALDKVERHTGAPVHLSPWARRVPWLAAPAVLIRLLRQGRLR